MEPSRVIALSEELVAVVETEVGVLKPVSEVGEDHDSWPSAERSPCALLLFPEAATFGALEFDGADQVDDPDDSLPELTEPDWWEDGDPPVSNADSWAGVSNEGEEGEDPWDSVDDDVSNPEEGPGLSVELVEVISPLRNDWLDDEPVEDGWSGGHDGVIDHIHSSGGFGGAGLGSLDGWVFKFVELHSLREIKIIYINQHFVFLKNV